MMENEILEEEKNERSNKKDKERNIFKEQIKDLEEKLLRNHAELQNYKRRKEDEIDRMLKYSNEDIIREILPILDNFERAICMDDENMDDEVSKFLEGFKMIYASFNNVIREFGVSEIESLGRKFDPNYHEALLTDSIIDKEDEIVLEVLQKGYILKDRVIRPAMVKVNINKEKENDKNE